MALATALCRESLARSERVHSSSAATSGALGASGCRGLLAGQNCAQNRRYLYPPPEQKKNGSQRTNANRRSFLQLRLRLLRFLRLEPGRNRRNRNNRKPGLGAAFLRPAIATCGIERKPTRHVAAFTIVQERRDTSAAISHRCDSNTSIAGSRRALFRNWPGPFF
jgi:hypothetical protein